jgi:hypothetical protein
MGAAILITLGVIFLLENYFHISAHRTFPILFLVIGGMLLVSRSGSTEGHVNPSWYNPQIPPQTPQQWGPGPGAPPPPANSGFNPNDPQVKP